MKYCSHCGKQIMDEAVICVHCGCPVDNTVRPQVKPPENPKELLNTLSQRVQIGGILWIIIGSFQVLYALILLFLFFDWFAAVIGCDRYFKYRYFGEGFSIQQNGAG